jgi:hypothetical protein
MLVSPSGKHGATSFDVDTEYGNCSTLSSVETSDRR